MRQKVKVKNLKYNFLRFDKEKNIEAIPSGGWHFNNIMNPKDISTKLKTFAHKEFSVREFSAEEIIKYKIEKKIDLFGRGHNYKAVELNEKFPSYILNNLEKFKSLEKKSKNNSKCNSISLKSKHSKNISQDRYKAEEQEADAENDILNENERSEFSKKSESLKISEKKSSRVQSLKSNEEKNERFVVDKEPEVYEPEAEPMPEPDAEKYGDDFE